MARWRDRWWVVLTSLFAGLVAAGAGVLVVVAGQENADRVASVIGATAGVLGLGVSGASALQARRLRASSPLAVPAASIPAGGATAAPAASEVSMLAEAHDDARINQSNGPMTIHER